MKSVIIVNSLLKNHVRGFTVKRYISARSRIAQEEMTYTNHTPVAYRKSHILFSSYWYTCRRCCTSPANPKPPPPSPPAAALAEGDASKANVARLLDVLDDFENDDAHFDEIGRCSSLVEGIRLADLSVEDILQVLKRLHRVYTANEGRFRDTELLRNLADNLDAECIKRASRWSTSTFMQFLCQYDSIGFVKNAKILTYAVNKRYAGVLGSDLDTILRYLRLVNETNSWSKFRGNKYELEVAFKQHLRELSLNDLEVFLEPFVSLGCHFVSDALKKRLCRKVTKHFDSVGNSLLTKFFRQFHKQSLHSSNLLFITPWMLEMFNLLNAKIDAFDLECVTYAALLSTRLFVYDRRLLDSMAAKLFDSLQNDSEVDLALAEKAISAFTYFGHRSECEDLYEKLLSTFKKQPLRDRLLADVKTLRRILYDLANVGVYPMDLLKVALAKKTCEGRIERDALPYELHVLAASVRLECPEYRGLSIDKKMETHVIKERKQELPAELKAHDFVGNVDSSSMSSCLNASRRISPYNRMLYCTRGILDSMFGGLGYTHLCYVLPHFKKANLIFFMDDKMVPRRIPEKVKRALIVDPTKIKEPFQCYVVAFTSHNKYTDQQPMPMGHEIAKIRQCRRMGCEVITITRHGWLNVSVQEKKQMLKSKIYDGCGNSLAMFDRFG